MRIIRADRVGFCFGVKRAVRMAEDALERRSPICSLGSLIHNEQVVADLAARGLRVKRAASLIRKGAAVISSHGISPKVLKALSRRRVKIIDTTCPFVLAAQRIARGIDTRRYKTLIVGDANHPEIRALVDFFSGKVTVIKDARDAARIGIKKNDRVCMLSQTTQSSANFLDTVRAVIDTGAEEVRVFNTICKDAEDRQVLARRLAGKVDVMVVIGGRASANTRRLYDVCKKVLARTYHIETESDIDRRWFLSSDTVGVTSGASTPDWIIRRVIAQIRLLFKK